MTDTFSVAVVGAGPSGFFAADALLKGNPQVTVDLFDRLPSPYGLVRLGVAPDHPKIKAVTKAWEKMCADQSNRLRFFGNVTVGRDLMIDDLKGFYDAILFTSGAESDRRLGVPGEDLAGSHTATAFVAWYNGHPDARDLKFDLSQEVAFVVGQGNVAMDVARVLAKTPDELKGTDIAAHALEALAASKIREIHVIGRRGPAQVKFTAPEIRELGELHAADPIVDAAALQLNAASQQELAETEEIKKIFPILEGYAQRAPRAGMKQLKLRFLLSPVELKGEGKLQSVTLEKNALSGAAHNQSAKGTGDKVSEPCGLLFRSVGYKGKPIAGVPFDDKSGTIPNDKGRVAPGVYCAGWIKRGPSGVIGTNKPDAQESVEAILTDLKAVTPRTRDRAALAAALKDRHVRVVSWDDWKKIDAAEVARGAAVGKPREKFARVDEMLSVLGS